MNRNLTERRRYPRLKKELPLKLIAEGYDIVTHTQNISCIGAYCHVDKYIPAMTKLDVVLLLPANSLPKNQNEKVQCKGVVVRAEPAGSAGFNIAVFFNEISQRSKEKISRYVSYFLSQTNYSQRLR